MLARQNSKERSSPTMNPISQSLIIKKSINYFGMESRHHSKKFTQFQLHPIYKFSVVNRSKSEPLNFTRASFVISDNINIKQALWNIHRASPFSNSTSLREIILESSLAFNPEPTSGLLKAPYQLNPYQSSIESFDVSDLSISGVNLISKSIPQARIQTPITFALDSRKEATIDTGLSISSIKSDEVIFNSDTIEISKIDWEEKKVEVKVEANEEDDGEILELVDEGPRMSTKDHMFLSDTASKEKLSRKKSVPLYREESLCIANDLSSPIVRKIVICQESREGKMVQSRESSVEVKSASILKAIPVSGYLSGLAVHYNSIEGKSKSSPNPVEKNLVSLFLACSVISPILHNSIEILSCGLEHIAMLSLFGKVFTMGYGAGGVLGHGDFVSCAGLRCIDSLFSIIYLECGAYHTAAVTEGGQVYTWGRGDVGQLGINPEFLTQDEFGLLTNSPLCVQDLACFKIKSVACGQAHTLLLEELGAVYAFGWGDDGQLGFMPSELQANIMLFRPKKIDALKFPVQKVSAGATFSACVISNGEVFVWGNGSKGQLGLGSKCKVSYLPAKVESLNKDNIIDLCCGENSTICVSRACKAFAWGLGKVDNLGDSSKFPKGSDIVCFVPRQLEDVDLAHKIIMIKSTV